jgi:haloacetate dehalogenase
LPRVAGSYLAAGSRHAESSKPPTTADHAPYSKRAMAGDCLALMHALGHDRFAVAGHDRTLMLHAGDQPEAPGLGECRG